MDEDTADIPVEDETSAPLRGGTLIAVEADDAAGEDPVTSDSESEGDDLDEDHRGSYQRSDVAESDEEEENDLPRRQAHVNFADLQAHERQELESDGEFEDEIGVEGALRLSHVRICFMLHNSP